MEIAVCLIHDLSASGWLRQRLPGRACGTDFLTLVGLLLHTWRLRGAELDKRVHLGLANWGDEGRLYAHVSDTGLAIEMGMKRQTIAAAAQRLAAGGLVQIRRSRGPLPMSATWDRPDGGGPALGPIKLYLLSEELASWLVFVDDDGTVSPFDLTAPPDDGGYGSAGMGVRSVDRDCCGSATNMDENNYENYDHGVVGVSEDDDRQPSAPGAALATIQPGSGSGVEPAMRDETALTSALRMYREEIGRVTPLVARKLDELTKAYPEPWRWELAFEAVAYSNVRRLDYLVRVLRDDHPRQL